MSEAFSLAPFEFLSAGRIVFGSGTAQTLGERAKKLGARALWVTGRDRARVAALEAQLQHAGIELAAVSVGAEPRVEDAVAAVAAGQRIGAQLVVACGGGSALDLGKAAAALLANPRDPLDFLETIGRGQPLTAGALPLIALPTTAGTGAEVTKNAVLTSGQHGVKASLRHDSMLPAIALIDPQLTLSMPSAVTAATGLDAFTQCLEPFVSCAHNPLTDALAWEGMKRGARSLRLAFHDGTNLAAREDMALCSLFGGLALANAKLGAVHGFAAAIGGQLVAPHGAVCARLLPLVMQTNVAALRARAPHSPLLRRYQEIAQLLTGSAGAGIEDGVAFVAELAHDLAIPALASYGMTTSQIPSLVAKAAVASSTKGNPLVLTTAELTQVMERAL